MSETPELKVVEGEAPSPFSEEELHLHKELRIRRNRIDNVMTVTISGNDEVVAMVTKAIRLGCSFDATCEGVDDPEAEDEDWILDFDNRDKAKVDAVLACARFPAGNSDKEMPEIVGLQGEKTTINGQVWEKVGKVKTDASFLVIGNPARLLAKKKYRKFWKHRDESDTVYEVYRLPLSGKGEMAGVMIDGRDYSDGHDLGASLIEVRRGVAGTIAEVRIRFED